MALLLRKYETLTAIFCNITKVRYCVLTISCIMPFSLLSIFHQSIAFADQSHKGSGAFNFSLFTFSSPYAFILTYLLPYLFTS